ncbi:RNA binding motif protein 6 [Cricetulus griseus]
MPPVDPKILDYIQPSTQEREHSGVNVNKREEPTHDHAMEMAAFGVQKGEFEHSETREGETQSGTFEHESPSDFQNSQSPVQDQDKPKLPGGEQQSSDAGLFKEEGDLDFLGRQDTDYRNIEYCDVDHRLPGSQIFGYGQNKSFPQGKMSRDAQQELQDQDYRTGPSEEKPNRLIRLSGVPKNATKEEILNAFRTSDGIPVKELQLKEYNTGYDYGYVCVEFSLLEDAIGCMEANQGTLMIHDKEVTLEYVPSPDFWYCKRCKASTGGHQSSCSFCKGPKEAIMLKRIYRSTPPEVIVEVLEPYVHLTTANVRIIKNRTGPMGHTYGFIDLDSHAEALRVVKILQNLDPPFSIDGKMVAVNLATGKRRVKNISEIGEEETEIQIGPQIQIDKGNSPKVVNPLIGLLGEYGGDSDYEEEEEEEQAPPVQLRTAQPQQREELTKKENEEDKLTDWNKLACLLCRRQFPNKEVLIKHQQLSDLHKQNLEIHRKIKQSEQELAYLERREREGRFKERGNDRREKLQSFDSPERKRIKYSRETDSDRNPVDKEDTDTNSKGGCAQQAAGWRKGTGLGYSHPGLGSSEETEGRMRGPGGAPGRTSKRQSNETYRDAVRRVMFARYKELD